MDENSYDPSVIADMKRMLNTSGKIIDGYRHALGNLALDRDIVVAKYVKMVYGDRHYNDDADYEHASEICHAIQSSLDDKVVTSLGNYQLPFVWRYVEAEVRLWDCVIHGENFDRVNRSLMDDIVVERFDMLRTVYENPSHLSFYEAGIWDEELISRCITDGIDASLVSSLFEVQNG